MRSQAVDAFLAAALLALAAPLVLALMLLDRLLTGRAIYKQTRAGQHLRPFRLYKLSTMEDDPARGDTISVAGDPRVPRYGRFLRTWKLNELPQLLNVVRGEMRLVGPRPLPFEEIDRLPRGIAEEVFRLSPGLTGISAILFSDEERLLARSGAPATEYFTNVLPRKMQLELDYAARRTWWTDLALLAATVPVLFAPGLKKPLLGWLFPPRDRAAGE